MDNLLRMLPEKQKTHWPAVSLNKLWTNNIYSKWEQL